jgi:hypothetical protein
VTSIGRHPTQCSRTRDQPGARWVMSRPPPTRPGLASAGGALPRGETRHASQPASQATVLDAGHPGTADSERPAITLANPARRTSPYVLAATDSAGCPSGDRTRTLVRYGRGPRCIPARPTGHGPRRPQAPRTGHPQRSTHPAERKTGRRQTGSSRFVVKVPGRVVET